MNRELLIKRLQELHLKFMKNERIDKRGLCTVFYHHLSISARRMFTKIFSPYAKDLLILIDEGTGETYWGNDTPQSFLNSNVAYVYTPRRQSLMLLFIEVLKDEQYLKHHFPQLLKEKK